MLDKQKEYIEKSEFDMLPIEILKTAKYQKGRLNVSRAKAIAKNFDSRKAGAILVSYRDNNYWILDGQHRWAAAKMTGLERIMCHILFGLSYKEEAEFFATQDNLNRSLNAITKFEAKLEYEDENALKIKEITDNKGITISRSHSDFHITAIGTVEKIYNKLGGDGLSRVLDLILDTWDGENISLQSNMLKGVAELIRRFEYRLKDNLFIRKLSRTSPKEIKREADSATYHNDTVKVSYAKVLFKYYNKNLTKNKLSWPVE